jgi:hypothetical protein
MRVEGRALVHIVEIVNPHTEFRDSGKTKRVGYNKALGRRRWLTTLDNDTFWNH